MTSRWLTLVVMLGLLLSGGLALPGWTTAAGGWSTPVRISGDTDWAWFPDIAVDTHDEAHVVWNASPPQTGTFPVGALYYARGRADGWTPPNDVSLIWQGHALRSALAVDAANRLHLVYKGLSTPDPAALARRTLGEEDLWHMSAAVTDAGPVSTWSKTQKLTLGGQGYFSDLAIDSQGRLHVIFTEAEGGRWGLFYRRSEDGGQSWSPRIALELGRPVWWYRAHLVVDPWDRLHAVWEVTDAANLGRTLGASYARSVDGGLTWQPTSWTGQAPDLTVRPLDDGKVAGPQQPTVGIDGWSRTIVVYREADTRRIVYRLSDDGVMWRQPEPIPGITAGIPRPYDVYAMATDSAGRVHLVTVGIPTGSDWMSLLHSVWDGRGWSTPTVVMAAPPVPAYAPGASVGANDLQARPLRSPQYPEYPRLAIGRGNHLHLVWFGGDRPSVDRAAMAIWYSTLRTDAPERTVPATVAGITATPPARDPAPVTSARPPVTDAAVPPPELDPQQREAPSMAHRAGLTLPLLAAGGAVALLLLVVVLARHWTSGRLMMKVDHGD